MINPYEIPLQPTPQTLTIPLGANTYRLVVKWNPYSSSWVVDINTNTGQPIVSGIPLVTGANLLEQYDYLNLGGQLIVQTDTDVDAVPTFANLGLTSHLFFVVVT